MSSDERNGRTFVAISGDLYQELGRRALALAAALGIDRKEEAVDRLINQGLEILDHKYPSPRARRGSKNKEQQTGCSACIVSEKAPRFEEPLGLTAGAKSHLNAIIARIGGSDPKKHLEEAIRSACIASVYWPIFEQRKDKYYWPDAPTPDCIYRSRANRVLLVQDLINGLILSRPKEESTLTGLVGRLTTLFQTSLVITVIDAKEKKGHKRLAYSSVCEKELGDIFEDYLEQERILYFDQVPLHFVAATPGSGRYFFALFGFDIGDCGDVHSALPVDFFPIDGIPQEPMEQTDPEADERYRYRRSAQHCLYLLAELMEHLTRDSATIFLTTYKPETTGSEKAESGTFEDYLAYLVKKHKEQTPLLAGKPKAPSGGQHTELKRTAIKEWLSDLTTALEEPYVTAVAKPAFAQLQYARTFSTRDGERSVPSLFFIMKTPLVAGQYRYKEKFKLDYTLRYLIPDSQWEDIKVVVEDLAQNCKNHPQGEPGLCGKEFLKAEVGAPPSESPCAILSCAVRDGKAKEGLRELLASPVSLHSRSIIDTAFSSGLAEYVREERGKGRDCTLEPDSKEGRQDRERRALWACINNHINKDNRAPRLYITPIQVGGAAYLAAITLSATEMLMEYQDLGAESQETHCAWAHNYHFASTLIQPLKELIWREVKRSYLKVVGKILRKALEEVDRQEIIDLARRSRFIRDYCNSHFSWATEVFPFRQIVIEDETYNTIPDDTPKIPVGDRTFTVKTEPNLHFESLSKGEYLRSVEVWAELSRVLDEHEASKSPLSMISDETDESLRKTILYAWEAKEIFLKCAREYQVAAHDSLLAHILDSGLAQVIQALADSPSPDMTMEKARDVLTEAVRTSFGMKFFPSTGRQP